MKKAIIVLLLIMAGSLQAADVVITITIPEAKVAEVQEALFTYMPNSQTKLDPVWIAANPDWEADGLEPDQIPKYTAKQWFKQILIDFLKRCYRKGKIKIASEAANQTIDPNALQ